MIAYGHQGDEEAGKARDGINPAEDGNAVFIGDQPLIQEVACGWHGYNTGDNHQCAEVTGQHTPKAEHRGSENFANTDFFGASCGHECGQAKYSEAIDQNGEDAKKCSKTSDLFFGSEFGQVFVPDEFIVEGCGW